MSAPILESRGYFWPATTVVPEKQFAPEECVHGIFRIRHDGSAELELDNLFPHRKRFAFGEIDNCTIVGKLRGDSRSVLMFNARSKGFAFHTNNLSHENYETDTSLIGVCSPEYLNSLISGIVRVDTYLGKFEEWLNVRPFAIKRTARTIKVSASIHKEETIPLRAGYLSIHHQIDGMWRGETTEFENKLSQATVVGYRSNSNLSLEEAAYCRKKLHELLILLSDQELSIEWPLVKGSAKSRPVRLYYQSTIIHENEYDPFKECINYRMICNEFGSIFESWMNGCEKHNAGYYLYLSTRRGVFQYSEALFMSLIWGLEALHRTTFPSESRQKPNSVPKHILKIMAESDKLNGRHRRFLRKKMENAAEPSLQDRLFDLFSELPIGFESASLRRFCKKMC